jgi:DNA-binding transcriptional regulator YiaG
MKSKEKQSFQEQIKAQRVRLKISQEMTALMTGYSERTVQHWEAGTRTPHQATQDAVIRTLQSKATQCQNDRNKRK